MCSNQHLALARWIVLQLIDWRDANANASLSDQATDHTSSLGKLGDLLQPGKVIDALQRRRQPCRSYLQVRPIQSNSASSLALTGRAATSLARAFSRGCWGAKRLELLRQVVPTATSIAVLVEGNNPEAKAELIDLQAAAQASGTHLIVVSVRKVSDIEPAFATFIQRGAGALFAGAGPFLCANRKQLDDLAARQRLPASYSLLEFAMVGGRMSYGTSISEAFRQIAIYVGRIRKGEKPAELPVVQSTKFEFVLNLKTAKALGLAIPSDVLAIADEVIE